MALKKIVKEFQDFISRGSVVDLAVGVIVGGAFTTIVNSLVANIIQPLISFYHRRRGGDSRPRDQPQRQHRRLWRVSLRRH